MSVQIGGDDQTVLVDAFTQLVVRWMHHAAMSPALMIRLLRAGRDDDRTRERRLW